MAAKHVGQEKNCNLVVIWQAIGATTLNLATLKNHIFLQFFPQKSKKIIARIVASKDFTFCTKKPLNPTISWMHNSQSHKQNMLPISK